MGKAKQPSASARSATDLPRVSEELQKPCHKTDQSIPDTSLGASGETSSVPVVKPKDDSRVGLPQKELTLKLH